MVTQLKTKVRLTGQTFLASKTTMRHEIKLEQ